MKDREGHRRVWKDGRRKEMKKKEMKKEVKVYRYFPPSPTYKEPPKNKVPPNHIVNTRVISCRTRYNVRQMKLGDNRKGRDIPL